MDLDETARRALDRLMIREVIDSYGAHYDEQRMDDFDALFTDDAVLDFEPDPGYFPTPLVGKDMISLHMGERNAIVSKTAQRRHVTTNTSFQHLDDDTARTESFLTVLSVDHGGNAPVINATGVYRDVLHKVDGQWLIAERKATLDAVLSAKPQPVTSDKASAGDDVAASAGTVDPMGKTWADVESEIIDEIGTELPDEISQYAALDPEMFRAYRDFRFELLDQGVIARKDKLLMVLAVLTVLHQGDAMRMYAGIARKEGATPEEVLDALRVGILFSGGPGIVAASGAAVSFGQD